MYPIEPCAISYWWIVPIILMILCFFMMRRRRSSMMCCFGPWASDCRQTKAQDSARDVLDRRYASGDINRDEYEEKKRALNESADQTHE